MSSVFVIHPFIIEAARELYSLLRKLSVSREQVSLLNASWKILETSFHAQRNSDSKFL